MRPQKYCEECGRPIESNHLDVMLCRRCSEQRSRDKMEAGKRRAFRRDAAREF